MSQKYHHNVKVNQEVWFPSPYTTPRGRFIDGGSKAIIVKAHNIGGTLFYTLKFKWSYQTLVIPADAVERI